MCYTSGTPFPSEQTHLNTLEEIMSEPTEEKTVTVAEKRKWLQENGYAVGSRGHLSSEAEQAYADAHSEA